MTDRKPDPDSYSESETAKHAAATLKVMLATPHKPHKPAKAANAAMPRVRLWSTGRTRRL